jgi:hypothetical protein
LASEAYPQTQEDDRNANQQNYFLPVAKVKFKILHYPYARKRTHQRLVYYPKLPESQFIYI